MAFKRTFNADKCFYFRYTAGEYQLPHAELDSPETGKVCFVPSCTPDPFWGTQNPVTVEQAHCNARSKVDSLLSEDGKSGMLRELYEADKPLIIFTHWQSLFSDGRAVGMQWFEVLLQRIAKVFGDNVEWVDFDELTRIYS